MASDIMHLLIDGKNLKMKIKVISYARGQEREIINGQMLYEEGESRQEGKPAFFIMVNTPTAEYEIHFLTDTVKEMEDFVESLKKTIAGFKK